MKKCIILLFLILSIHEVKAQQYGLFNTHTLFDSFENPAQTSFTLDSSRKYATNFFLPYFGINAADIGNNDFTRRLLSEEIYSSENIPLGTNEINHVYENSNFYVLTFKVFKSYKYHKEIGFSWQIRTDAQLNYTNETLAIFDNYKKFKEYPNTDFTNAFNDNGYAQSYHQFSINYREDYNNKLAFGVKLSLLSGITYNQLNIVNSTLLPESTPDALKVTLDGRYRASFLKYKELSKKTLMPTFKNPGIAVSFGTKYNAKSGIFIMANVKDLGIIRWNNNSYINDFNRNIDVTNSDNADDQLTDIATKDIRNSSFYSLTNAKADFLISKTFNFYTPGIIVSKNLFYRGGDFAFINRFSYSDFSLSAIPTYNFNKLFLFGLQGMYQTPNFEVFFGSDNIFKTIPQIKGAVQQDATIGSGYNGASFYMGLGIKFGGVVSHPQNSSQMPGIKARDSGYR